MIKPTNLSSYKYNSIHHIYQSINQSIYINLSINLSIYLLINLSICLGLADVLSGEGPFTVFAPTNDAFEKVPKVLQSIYNYLDVATDFMYSHKMTVVAGYNTDTIPLTHIIPSYWINELTKR